MQNVIRNTAESFRIPAGIFNEKQELVTAFHSFRIKQTEHYLSLAAEMLDYSFPAIAYDSERSVWIILPADHETALIGPVQTGRNPNYIFHSCMEYSESTLSGLGRLLCMQIYGSDKKLVIFLETIIKNNAVQQEYEVDPMPALYESIQSGDLENLNRIRTSPALNAYLNIVMMNEEDAKTVFLFNTARCYHIAVDRGVPVNDAVEITDRYLEKLFSIHTPDSIRAVFLSELYDYTHMIHKLRNDRHSPLVRNAIFYIHNHLYQPIRITDIAEACNISLSALQHRFKEETGITVKQEIRNARLKKAQWFLDNTALSSSDIAYRLRYSSQSWFIHEFSGCFGMTPNQYRNRQR